MHLAASAMAASNTLLNVGVGRILPSGGGVQTHDIFVASQYYFSRSSARTKAALKPGVWRS